MVHIVFIEQAQSGLQHITILLDIITKTTTMKLEVKRINTIHNTNYILYDIDIVVKNIDELNKYINVIESMKSIASIQRGNK